MLAFFKWIDLHLARDLEIHVVLDNLSAHKAEPVRRWLAHASGPLRRSARVGTSTRLTRTPRSSAEPTTPFVARRKAYT